MLQPKIHPAFRTSTSDRTTKLFAWLVVNLKNLWEVLKIKVCHLWTFCAGTLLMVDDCLPDVLGSSSFISSLVACLVDRRNSACKIETQLSRQLWEIRLLQSNAPVQGLGTTPNFLQVLGSGIRICTCFQISIRSFKDLLLKYRGWNALIVPIFSLIL